MLPGIKEVPGFGTWSDTSLDSSSSDILHVKPDSSSIFLASAIVLFLTSTNVIVSIFELLSEDKVILHLKFEMQLELQLNHPGVHLNLLDHIV